MRNKPKWIPTKFVYRHGKLTASRDTKYAMVGSRLLGDIVAQAYANMIPKHVKGKLVDLGCGEVPLFATYRPYICDNICVDWGDTQHSKEYLDCVCDLTAPLPFADQAFDTVIISDVLEHLPQPEAVWREMARILAPGGKVLLTVPFFYWLHEQPHDFYRYTEFALRRFAETNGFQVVFLEPLGGAAEIITDILAKHLQGIRWVGPPLAMLIQSVMLAFTRTVLGKKLASKTSRGFPLEYFMVAQKASEGPTKGAEVGANDKI
jgi:SAM-dependent methyltransferase